MIIDAHQHFWQLSQPFDYSWLKQPELAPICRDFLPTDLQLHLQATGISHAIFVQTQHNLAENRWVLQLAGQYDFIAGVVGWVDLASPDCETQLLEFLPHPKFVGVRHVTQDEPDDNFIIRPEIIRGLQVLEKHGVPFDLLFYVKHLHHAPTLGKTLPQQIFILDHLAKPPIKARQFEDWQRHLHAAAAYPNFYCKLSGLVTEADWHHWQPADLRPYVDAALTAFGPERCLFGTDWPVCELAAPYERVVQTMRELLAGLSPTEQDQIFSQNAKRVYKLTHIS